MTHEFRNILEDALQNRQKGLKSVLASVVALDGSSYRKPGVRMLIAEDGAMTGAVSGGCVEKEVLLQAESVIKDGKAKIMTYDGRYRLGCEGILYILLEPFDISVEVNERFGKVLRERKNFNIESYFAKEEICSFKMGSIAKFEDGTKHKFSDYFEPEAKEELSVFSQEMKPLFKMLIFGAEHDAVQLCSAASLLGWEVSIIAPLNDPRKKEDFPGAQEVLHITPEESGDLKIDRETAVVLMNHNYARDLKFLLAIKDKDPVYIGLLGSVKRREKLFHELIEYHPEISDSLLDRIHGPAGLNIGAITPQEIAVSVLAEILAVIREKEAIPLKQTTGKIHN